MNEDLIRKRQVQLEENISRDLDILHEYEVRLQYEDDPRRIAKYRREIERQRASYDKNREEYDELEAIKSIDNGHTTADLLDRQSSSIKKLQEIVGIVEIRGSVAEVVDGIILWDVSNFAGFYYDIDNNIGTECLRLTITNGNVLDYDTGIIYMTTAQNKKFDFDEWGEYLTIGFMADEYFAGYVDGHLIDESADKNLMADEKLSKILMDDDEERAFTTATPLKLADNYELAIKAIDLDVNKVHVQLTKDGAVIDSAIVEPSKAGATIKDKTYTYKKNLGEAEKIVIIAVHFKNAFRGAETDLATVDGIWQISDTYISIKEETEYDKMTIQMVDVDSMAIMMNNEDNKVILTKNKDMLLMENIRIKTANQDVVTVDEPLRFYIYKEMTIEP